MHRQLSSPVRVPVRSCRLRGADKLAGAVRSALTLGTFAGLLGMLIVFYMLYQNAADALPVMNILLYQLIWYIPVFIITQQTDKI